MTADDVSRDMPESVLDPASLEAARKLGREAPPLSDETVAMLQAAGFPFQHVDAEQRKAS